MDSEQVNKIDLSKFVYKKTVAKEMLDRTSNEMKVIIGAMIMLFLSAAASRNMYSIIFSALGLGWCSVFLLKAKKFSNYLKEKYDLEIIKNE